jgi:hypothetical protein
VEWGVSKLAVRVASSNQEICTLYYDFVMVDSEMEAFSPSLHRSFRAVRPALAPPAKGPILFAGLAAILTESAIRRSRR